MRALMLSIALMPFAAPAWAQDAATSVGQASQGSGVGSVLVPGPSPAIADPGQLDFGGRGTAGTGGTGGMPSGGAGLSNGGITIPTPAEDYTQPIYGRGLR